MQTLNIFLGSSFKMMRTRKRIGDTVRVLNDKYINQDLHIKLNIWEDYTIGYSGKHKQQEYIDEMVLPSEICIFLFSHRVGKFTEMELEAKLQQNALAVSCFRMPYYGKWKQKVTDSLSTHNVSALDVQNDDELCQYVEKIVEEYILNQRIQLKPGHKMDELYFYTTIPADLPNVRTDVGTMIRDLDDSTIDDWGIHCVLHPRCNKALLDETDHYMPILNKEIDDNEFDELCAGREKAADENHRLKRMTVFDMGNIHSDNPRVRDFLDQYGIFPDKAKEMDSMKWQLLKWIRKERKKIFSTYTVSVDASNGVLSVNNKPIAPLGIVDVKGGLDKSAQALKLIEEKISTLYKSGADDSDVLKLVTDCKEMRSAFDVQLTNLINKDTFSIFAKTDEGCQLRDQIISVEQTIESLTDSPLTKETAGLLLECLKKLNILVGELYRVENCTPEYVASQFLYSIGVFDTYLHPYYSQTEEDQLYLQLVEFADKTSVKDPMVEVMRMNIGNMYSRIEDYNSACSCYEKAIANLQSMGNDCPNIKRNITYVFAHYIHTVQEHVSREKMGDVLMMFREHIARMDETDDKYLIDRCMFATAELTSIDIEDDNQIEVLHYAEDLFREANEKGQIKPDDFVYGDVFVYLPNMIARYYIDHRNNCSEEQLVEYSQRADDLLKKAWKNSHKLAERHFEEGLFHQGEIMHNLGFLCSSSPQMWDRGLKSYQNALNLESRLLKLTNESAGEPRIAHTLMNYGALELQIMQQPHLYQASETLALNPLKKAEESMKIYGKHMEHDFNSELGYFQALQLKATILDELFSKHPQAIILYNEAMDSYFKCWCWLKDHIDNEYRMCFLDLTGGALLKRNFITQQEYDEVKEQCEAIVSMNNV